MFIRLLAIVFISLVSKPAMEAYPISEPRYQWDQCEQGCEPGYALISFYPSNRGGRLYPRAIGWLNNTDGRCEYNITGDMYGLGARTGFYFQAISNIFTITSLVNGSSYSVSGSVVLCFALIFTFALGYNESALALEAPIFASLLTMVSLPHLSHATLKRLLKRRVDAQGYLFTLAVLTGIGQTLLIWGVVDGWDRGPPQCDVLSGLSGYSALSTGGRIMWAVLFLSGMITAFILAYTILYTTGGRNDNSDKPWIKTNQWICFQWTMICLLLYIICILSVELTIRRHISKYRD